MADGTIIKWYLSSSNDVNETRGVSRLHTHIQTGKKYGENSQYTDGTAVKTGLERAHRPLGYVDPARGTSTDHSRTPPQVDLSQFFFSKFLFGCRIGDWKKDEGPPSTFSLCQLCFPSHQSLPPLFFFFFLFFIFYFFITKNVIIYTSIEKNIYNESENRNHEFKYLISNYINIMEPYGQFYFLSTQLVAPYLSFLCPPTPTPPHISRPIII